MRIFIGYDPRQPVALQVLMRSIYDKSTKPVSITPLVLSTLPITRVGLTEFTYSRYLCPFLCGYWGWSLFLDADMLLLDDIQELFALTDDAYAVMVVKNPKLRFEWPSLMLFNNAKCGQLTPEYVDDLTVHPQAFEWGTVGELPAEWNHCIGYDEPKDAKLVHYTQGIPCFKETADSEYKQEWSDALKMCNATVSWTEIMGNSVHAKHVLARKTA
jgi:lipopolysaccharide biosynthesis glycosyltransferase